MRRHDSWVNATVPKVRVPNVRRAGGRIATAWRRRFDRDVAMDEHLFSGITNPARRRRLLLQHAARVAQEVADAAQELGDTARTAGLDLDPLVLNRAAQLRKLIQTAAEIEDAPMKPNAKAATNHSDSPQAK